MPILRSAPLGVKSDGSAALPSFAGCGCGRGSGFQPDGSEASLPGFRPFFHRRHSALPPGSFPRIRTLSWSSHPFRRSLQSRIYPPGTPAVITL